MQRINQCVSQPGRPNLRCNRKRRLQSPTLHRLIYGSNGGTDLENDRDDVPTDHFASVFRRGSAGTLGSKASRRQTYRDAFIVNLVRKRGETSSSGLFVGVDLSVAHGLFQTRERVPSVTDIYRAGMRTSVPCAGRQGNQTEERPDFGGEPTTRGSQRLFMTEQGDTSNAHHNAILYQTLPWLPGDRPPGSSLRDQVSNHKGRRPLGNGTSGIKRTYPWTPQKRMGCRKPTVSTLLP